jgi:serine/threonine protein kinase
MHARGICHRDVKAENIIVGDHGKLKIIDFGFSVQFQPEKGLGVFCGTSHYMAPEIIQKKRYNGMKADIWALGVLCVYMLTAVFPFRGATEKDLFAKI